MGIKRTEKDGHFLYLDDEQEKQELLEIAEDAKIRCEEILDVFYADNDAKALSTISWTKNKIDHICKYAHSVDIAKQQIARLLITYDK